MKTRMVHRCSECGGESPRWLGRCPDVRRVGHPGRAGRHVAGGGASLRTRAEGPVPIGDVDARVAVPVPTGVAELDRVLEGGLVAGLGHAARGRAGHGQEHAAAPGARPHGRRRHAVPARHRRGVVRAGAAAGRAGRRARPRPARRGRDLAAARARPRRRGRGPACSRSTRSRPSSIPTFPARRARSRRCATARTGWCSRRRSASLATVLVGHVTKEGTRRRAAGARARRRHRALVRRRPRPLASHRSTR